MFWILAALLTIAVVAIVLYPLSRKAEELDSADAYDLTVYKSQLKEIDGDVERGLIAESEAEAARAEVARRLLYTQSAMEQDAAAQATETNMPVAKAAKGKSKRSRKANAPAPQPKARSVNARIAAVLAFMVIPFAGFGLYFVLGSPELESQPLAYRLQKAPEKQSLTELVASAERHLKQNPDDLAGWKKLAPIYLSMRRPDQAIQAYHNVLRLEGETVKNLSDLGEAMVVSKAGVVTQQAYKIFQRANALAPKEPKPRFFLAIGLGQQGKTEEAIASWKGMIAEDGKAAWVPFAKSQIAALEKKQAKDAVAKLGAAPNHSATIAKSEKPVEASSDAPGPTQEDVKAAAQMSAEDRQEMIANMVSQLEERLNDEGGTADEWVRLIRAELVMKRPDKAAKTVTKAMDALQSDVDGLAKIKAAARSLGLSVNK